MDGAWGEGVSDDVKTFAASLTVPYCGLNAGFEAAGWLNEPVPVQSLAMVPLRRSPDSVACFGLLVLGSPDALRYQADMGTEFLDQVGDIASAALARMLPEPRLIRHAAPAPVDSPLPAPLPEPLPRYLDHLRVERRVADRTLALYTDALQRLAQRPGRPGRAARTGAGPPCAQPGRPAAWPGPGAAQPGAATLGLARLLPLVGP